MEETQWHNVNIYNRLFALITVVKCVLFSATRLHNLQNFMTWPVGYVTFLNLQY